MYKRKTNSKLFTEVTHLSKFCQNEFDVGLYNDSTKYGFIICGNLRYLDSYVEAKCLKSKHLEFHDKNLSIDKFIQIF